MTPIAKTVTNGDQVRSDIEESKKLAVSMPGKAQASNAELTNRLTEMKASYPYHNPHCKYPIANKEKVPTVLSFKQNGDIIELNYQTGPWLIACS